MLCCRYLQVTHSSATVHASSAYCSRKMSTLLLHFVHRWYLPLTLLSLLLLLPQLQEPEKALLPDHDSSAESGELPEEAAAPSELPEVASAVPDAAPPTGQPPSPLRYTAVPRLSSVTV